MMRQQSNGLFSMSGNRANAGAVAKDCQSMPMPSNDAFIIVVMPNDGG
jgi:hypothetical protein